MSVHHIVDALLAGARQAPDAPCYIFPDDGGRERRTTRAGLVADVRRAAANLLRVAAPGDRVALQLPQGEDYVTAFWACLYVGLVPVPLFPSSNADVRRRLAGIVAGCGAAAVLTLEAGAGAPAGGPAWIDPSALRDDAAPADPASLEPGTLAYLQYSSGSTGAPKGVAVSHANIMANLDMIARAAAVHASDVFVNWLPLHHDLGLVNTVLLPVFAGCPSVIGTPLSFMRNPLSWPAMIARYGGTVSGGPNFAYQAVVDRLRSRAAKGAALLEGLDLRRWRVAFNAAEPIQTATLEAFAQAFAPAGFDAGTFFAAYGMAEATVFVCGAAWDREREASTARRGDDAARLAATIACGPADPRHVAVVDATGRPVAPGTEGEIWIRGPHVSRGYFGHPDDVHSPFRRTTADGDGPFFATGDSGLVRDGRLYVLGRIKDIIIQNGRNIHPTDVEQVVNRVLAGDNRYVGFAAIGRRQAGTEAVVLVLEARPRASGDDTAVLDRIAARVFEDQGILLDEMLLVPQGAIEKTSSGKVRRQALRASLESGRLAARGFRPQAGDEGDGSGEGRNNAEPAADPAREAELAALLSDLTGHPVDDPRRSFFGYGMSSLQVYQAVAELAARYRVPLSARDVFEHPTLRRLGNRLAALIAQESLREAAPACAPPSIPGLLTANQQLMLSIDAWSPANPAYHLPLVLALDGADPVRLARAAEGVLERHEILRTVYPADRKGAHGAVLLPAAGLQVAHERLHGAPARPLLAELVRRPFDLGGRHPVRGCVLTEAGDFPGATLLALVFHHVAADGWSLRLLAAEILARHGANAGTGAGADADTVPFVLPAPPAAARDAALHYWKAKLAGLPDVHSLPLDGTRSGKRVAPASGRHALRLPPAAVDALRRLCAEQDATLFSGLHAVLALALARFGNHPDIVLGTFLAGRDTPQLRDRVGFLAHTALLRTTLDLSAGMADLVRLCRDTLREAHRHDQASYLDLLRELKPARDPSYNPLFQISLNYHDYGVAGAAESAGGGVARQVDVDAGAARYDLSVDVHPDDAGLRIVFEYDATLFEHGTVERLAAFWHALLDGALAAPHATVGRLSGGPPPALADAAGEPSGAVSLARRFHAVAAAAPIAVALRYEGAATSYGRLAGDAARLAAAVAAAGARPGDRVLLFMRRTPAYVTAILAVLELDCTYVPLDPDYYQDALPGRIGFIAPACVLVDAATRASLPATDVPVLVVGTEHEGDGDGTRPAAPPRHPDGRHPAYILFTSGSTGAPKAVSMGHRALGNLIDAIGDSLGVGAGQAPPVVLNYSSIAFDMHFTELFTALLHGGTVVLADAAMRRNTLALLELVRSERVSLLNLSYPVLCELALGAEQARVRLPALRTVLSTAQQLKITPVLRAFFGRHPGARLFNHYGPTETHVVTIAELGRDPFAWPDVPDIGRPICNCACFVMNASGVPEAPGAIGELYVAGVPLAEGYHANEGMTAERFVHVDVGAASPVRAYRTGDFVRIGNDGTLRYAGRRDHQIKVRGLRVDLSDIEASIQRCAGVAQAVVAARPLGGGVRIVAYVQPAPGATRLQDAVLEELRRSLPAYMVPDRVHLVDGFVLNQNGKIDTARLPLVAEPAPGAEAEEHVLPADASVHEKAVYGIWRKVLGHDAFGRGTNFFEAGGDSLALMAVKRELDLLVERDIDLVAIYGSPTVATLAVLVGGGADAGGAAAARPRRNLNAARRQRRAGASG